jgi:hypothetical protein
LFWDKGSGVEPLRRRRMVNMRVADQLRAVVGNTVEIGVHAAVGDGEREAAAQLDDGRNAPAR